MDYLKRRSPKSISKLDKITMTKHHILPVHKGGDNSKSNLIRIPLRFHVVAHWLLYKASGPIVRGVRITC
jgi:hypothetical protein